nr:N-acetylmuramoyl-L-alanine amidase [Clostridium botulinum]
MFKGRPDDSQGAHVSGYNKNSLGIAFEGNYDKDDKEMPKEQFNAWCELKSYLTNNMVQFLYMDIRKLDLVIVQVNISYN